jgi:tetratricopeptide (TPR) repeat protein
MKHTSNIIFVSVVLALAATGCGDMVLTLGQPTSPAPVGNMDAQFYVNRAKAELRQNDRADAYTDLANAIAVNSDCAEAYVIRARMEEGDGNNMAALNDYTRAIELLPNSASNYAARGRVKYRMRDFDGAVSDCSMAIQLSPNNAFHLVYRGMAYLQKGDVVNASMDFRKAVEMPTQEAISAGAGSLAKREAHGFLAYIAGEYREAANSWEGVQALAHSPDLSFWITEANNRWNSASH